MAPPETLQCVGGLTNELHEDGAAAPKAVHAPRPPLAIEHVLNGSNAEQLFAATG